MRFWKYQGLGNDFILVDGSAGDLEIDSEWCRGACDRHFGIGADGVLYVMPGEDTDTTMRIINADGTEAEMCGNGIRCLAKHVYDFGIVKKEAFTIHTLAGNMEATVTPENGKARTVMIDMGAPILDGRSIPVNHDGRFIDEDFEVDGVVIRGNAASMGNPHFITFTPLDDKVIDRLGPVLESHPFFPHKTNVEFCTVRDGKIHIVVYERGAAWTLACGSGACAVVTVAALNGLIPFGEPVDVHLPGGWLKITIDSDLSHVLMDGPAELVFEGTI